MLNGYYETPLVLVSILVAIVASYSALSLAGRVAETQGRAMVAWTVGGAIAMGSGIWAMHFVGMLAFRLPIPIAFDIPITLVSLLLPIAASGLALWQVRQAHLSRSRLAASALLMGAGINAMHYTGMAAMRMAPGIDYDPLLFALSVLIAILASALALWIAFRLRRNTPHVWVPRIGAAVVMGCAIVGMHYTGMAAARFPADSVCMAAQGGVQQGGLALLVVLASFGVLGLALLASVVDARMEANARILAMAQATSAERQQLLERERAARDQAERLSAMKDEFLATLSHELRTPLNAILGWAGMLQRGTPDAATLQRALQTIERNARAQGQLIDDLLDMSRIVAGTVRLDVQPIGLARVVEAALGTVHPAAAAKSIALRVDLADGRLEVRADPGRLQQVLWNLLANAVKFTPAGGSVEVRLQRDGSDALVQVIDSGIGITPDFLPHVFDRFRQQDASTTRQHGGLGLGLSIARQLVELHGGTIAVASPGRGAGTTFSVRLPLLRPQADAAAAVPIPAAVVAMPEPELASLVGVHVLLVDDAPDTLEVLDQILRHGGATVTTAPGAEAALALLARMAQSGALPDVLVSDIGMPGMDGHALIRSVRRLHPDMPAIALSAFTRKEDVDKALQAGFDEYLPKPVEAATLAAHIAQLAGQRGRAVHASGA
jgi:signal transduction histidine kinase/ActR/RegA family two-component response regulator